MEIMKYGLESYYFMYDPDFKKYALGIVSINWEI
jgi:arginyl-tRNA--protein-N-Asp/Glu arginylyltransferase